MAKTVSLLEPMAIAAQKTLHPKDFGAAEGKWAVHFSRLQGGLSDGVDIVDVNNGKLSFVVVPTRGMNLWRASLPGWSIGWKSPVRGPVHPKFVDLGEPSGLGWLDGFDELLVRCGLESNGAPEFDEETGRLKYPLHGRIANKPAHSVSVAFDAEREEISVSGVVEESRFHFLKLRMTSTYTTRLGSTTIAVRDEIENLSASPAEMQMLYHVNFGVPLLDAGASVVGTFKNVVPRNDHAAKDIKSWNSYRAAEPGFEEQVYFADLWPDGDDCTRTLLKNAHGTQGVSLYYNTRQLPCFSLWKNTTSEADGCVTGLEPGTNYPNPRSHEGKERRVVKLAGGEKTSFELVMEILPTANDVAAIEKEIARVAAGRKPELHQRPLKGWCAGVE
jgi:galactose mutarotase-like enzyme